DGDVASADLLGLGSGIYGMNVDKKLLEFVALLPQADGRKVFLFSTSGRGKGQTGALRKAVQKKGYSVVAEFACKGLDKWGPLKFIGGVNKGHPDATDLENARKFGASLA
ncbi:flavodoxin, partial [Candidatus Micrarchaeota archaeon]|nr:flavodoxin [Candidatus Micrarchaeota archaeon]